MSRSQGHRKSHSTSALSVLAGPGAEPSARNRLRASQHPGLNRVEEGGGSAGMSTLPGLSDGSRRNHLEKEDKVGIMEKRKSVPGAGLERWRGSGLVGGMDEVKGWMNDVMSLRSSDKQRLIALKGLEKELATACQQTESTTSLRPDTPTISDLVYAKIHQPILSLLTRHAQRLTLRAHSSSLSHDDEVASALVPELQIMIEMLQGLSLMSRECKATLGERWMIEILIDLLLLLRAQTLVEGIQGRPIAYNILEVLCCVLVDSPSSSRTFERLSGLEAVTRVLKGTGVVKEVRMKCIEFLYFYLLPEQTPQRAVSSSSTSSSSSAESRLFPPSPLSSSTGSNSSGRLTPSPTNLSSSGLKRSSTTLGFQDIDIPFIPQTPRKPAPPNLGYLTPSTHHLARKSSGGASVTPTLESVPASPRGLVASPSSRGFIYSEKDHTHRQMTEEDCEVGLGLGLPRNKADFETRYREVTAIKIIASPTFTDPFTYDSPTPASSESRSSSGSSTVIASPRTMSRSNTQPSLSIIQSSPRRQTSIRRVSRSPLVQSMIPEVQSPGSSSSPVPSPQVSKSGRARHSRTQSEYPAVPSHLTPPIPPLPSFAPGRFAVNLAVPSVTPQMARSPSRPSGMSRSPSRPSEMSRSPSRPSEMLRSPSRPSEVSRSPSRPSERSKSPSRPSEIPRPPSRPSEDSRSSSRPSETTRTPSKPKRAFPSELTRGLPSATSSPNLVPLGAAKRVMSGKGKDRGDIRSVEEKKELLGSWLGNVDALVQGVEKVSFWGSIGKQGV